uniref:Uncharacterized protein n=1 Tax=Tanacetum cinerariifolium TaxID=118510 RepID=A0A6L2P4I6_TANCI|nr:hypothetical protein [Tanacetum cinerariifolium]
MAVSMDIYMESVGLMHAEFVDTAPHNGGKKVFSYVNHNLRRNHNVFPVVERVAPTCEGRILKGQRRNSMRLKGESEERPRARLESQQRTGEHLRLRSFFQYLIRNIRSAENIADAEDFGPTTEKDGNINLVKEVVDPNRRNLCATVKLS